jgi:hypothetical protein
MISIYCIEDCDGLKYIGSTKLTLKKRYILHKSQSTSDNCKKCSSSILDYKTANIYLLESCEEAQRSDREDYWIKNTDCVNIKSGKRDIEKKRRYRDNYECSESQKERHRKTSLDRYYRIQSWGDIYYLDYSIFLT